MARSSVPPKRRLEQIRQNYKKGKNRRDVNDKFATLPELGGMAVPNLTTSSSLNNSFCESAASLPTFGDVSSGSRPTFQNTKYIFKSGCPTPDPQWPSEQQLMIGPIPEDLSYDEVRCTFRLYGFLSRLFIAHFDKEIIDGKNVKFGYVVYSDPEVVKNLLARGFVTVYEKQMGLHEIVPPIKSFRVLVKKMDGQPIIINTPPRRPRPLLRPRRLQLKGDEQTV